MNFLLLHIEKITGEYDLSVPLSIYLKRYFKSNPRLGSRDRKAISHGLFLYYRFAKRLPDHLSPFEVIYNGLRHSEAGNAFLESKLLDFDPQLPSKATSITRSARTVFPLFSGGVIPEEWEDSFFTQPDLFIRIREEAVIQKLDQEQIPYKIRSEGPSAACISLPNSVSLEKLLPPESYVVQDWASQQSIRFLLSSLEKEKITNIWDCCAGAGGKSLMIKDSLPAVNIAATDIRDTILHNLAARFALYRLPLPETFTLDMANRRAVRQKLQDRKFDLILCDAPCSGSGTWARTPEQYHFFRPESLKKLSAKQLQIVSNTIPYLQEGGRLAYITCSVFREENESVVSKICAENGMEVTEQQLINGISRKADSLFIAILKKT